MVSPTGKSFRFVRARGAMLLPRLGGGALKNPPVASRALGFRPALGSLIHFPKSGGEWKGMKGSV